MNTPDTEWIDIAIANLIFSGLSIAQMDKLPKWLLENMEENKTKFKETIISSRDTYWKERVRKEVEKKQKQVSGEKRLNAGLPNTQVFLDGYNHALNDIITLIERVWTH